jgi:hypothetical protein
MLSRRWMLNLGLLLLIGVSAYSGIKYDAQSENNSINRITALNSADINSVSIKTADELVELRRSDDNWQIDSPIRWPASNTNVERLLAITRAETESRIPADEIDLASLGLQPPKAMLRLNETTVLFGDTNNIGKRRYVMIDSTVFLLPDLHLPFMSQGLLGIVNRHLLPASTNLESLKLPEFELTRSENGAWQIKNAGQFSSDQLNHLVDNWQQLRASRVRLYPGTTIPGQKVIARLSDGRIHEFLVLSTSPEIIIAHPRIGLQYHFNKSFYDQLLAPRGDENSTS